MAARNNFEDIFDVQEVDKDGKKFERVSRFTCQSENYECELIIDLNSQLYPLLVGDKFVFALTTTLRKDGKPMEGEFDPTDTRPSKADQFDYVMYGKCYQVVDDSGQQLKIFISFGGLLACLRGEARNLSELELDKRYFAMMRKLS
eukprot:Clim_evm75s88 gene=Clim_evmTU75s88